MQNAMLFLNAVRRDAALRSALQSRQDDVGLEDLSRLGRAHGLVFSAHDLRDAFRHEWALRALLRRRKASTP